MTFRSRISLALAATLGLALAASVAPAAAQRARFQEGTSVVVVEVPVYVTRDGAPVRGLTADDFEVRVEGKRVRLIGFDAIDVAAPAAGEEGGATPPTSVPVTARRHFLMLFDLSFSEVDSVARAQQAARDLVLDGLAPSDMVGVATYSAARGVKIVLGFTSDRNQVEQALATLGLVDPYEKFDDPLGILIGELDSDLASRRQRGGAFETQDAPRTGRLADLRVDANATAFAAALDLQAMGEQKVRDQAESRILSLTGSMAELAGLLASVQGRVNVVLLSEGFDSSVVLGNEGTGIEDQARIEEINAAAGSGELWRVDSEARYGSSGARSGLLRMIESFKSANCAIQAVDIGGLRAGQDFSPGQQGQNGLFILANETGGELYRSTNNLGRAMGDMLERTSLTYVLAFEPKDLHMDGRYQRLDVKLKSGPKGARVVHRPGFYEPRPFTSLTPDERKIMTAGMVQGGSVGGGIELSVLAAPFRVGGEKAYVPVFIEVDGRSLLAGAPGWKQLPIEIYAYVFDTGGAVRDYFAQAVAIDLEATAIVMRHSGYKFWGHLDLAPGDYVARVMVRNAASGVAGIREVPISVPPADARLALLPPFFPEPTGKWVLGRERESEPRKTPYPYVVANHAVLPAARVVLWPGRGTEMRLLGYNLGSGDVRVESRVLGADGAAVEGAHITVSGRAPGALPGLEQVVATFDPGSLAPGDYSLEITLEDPAGAGAGKTTIPLSIEGGSL